MTWVFVQVLHNSPSVEAAHTLLSMAKSTAGGEWERGKEAGKEKRGVGKSRARLEERQSEHSLHACMGAALSLGETENTLYTLGLDISTPVPR